MVVMGFSFAVWVEGLDFGLRFPAKTILAGFRVVVVTDKKKENKVGGLFLNPNSLPRQN